MVPGNEPVANIRRRVMSTEIQSLELDLLAKFNRRHLANRPEDPLLAARIMSYETAFGMQTELPDVFDLSRESDATLAL